MTMNYLACIYYMVPECYKRPSYYLPSGGLKFADLLKFVELLEKGSLAQKQELPLVNKRAYKMSMGQSVLKIDTSGSSHDLS